MTKANQDKKKWGWKKNLIFQVIIIAAMLFLIFGGRGTSSGDIEKYALEHMEQVGYLDETDAVVTKSTIAVDGTQSRVVVMHLEDGRSAAVAFTKVPIFDYWKLSATTLPDSKSATVYIRADGEVESLLIKTDGKGYAVEEKFSWEGTYGHYLTSFAFFLVLFVIIELIKRLWRRHKSRNNERIED